MKEGDRLNVELREIRREDEKKAMQFAVKGMHLDRYARGKIALSLYARYFWYMETNRATQCIAAYADGRFAGILLAEITGEHHPYRRFWRKVYANIMQWFLDHFFSNSSGAYDEANEEMFRKYTETNSPDGELIFLAADPDRKIKGIGTKMLAELERREKGKLIYLYTDDGCTWQFYEHRGFDRVGEKDVNMELEGGSVPIKCLLYSKRLGNEQDAAGEL